MKFTIEDIYGLTRHQYCLTTGITPQDLIIHLDAEIKALRANYDTIQQEFINGGRLIEDEQRRRVKLLITIHNKIVSKRDKVKDINREFLIL